MALSTKLTVRNSQLSLGVSVIDARTEVSYVIPAAAIRYVSLKLDAALDTQNRNPYVSDFFVAVDTAQLGVGKGFDDLIGTSDSLLGFVVNKGLLEDVTPLEVIDISVGFIRAFADNAPAVDVFGMNFSTVFNESISIVDDIAIGTILSKEDVSVIFDDADVNQGPDWAFGKSTVELIGASDEATNSFEKALADNKDVLIETEVEYNGMKAHVDCFVPGTGDVIDWKTSKVRNLSYFPSNQQRWQVQLYGYLLANNGYAVNRVSLVAIARDGDERDIKVHTEAYDEAIALEALGWLAAVKESKEAPAPEKDSSYCQFYCKFYDASGEMGCVGIKKELTSVSEVIIADADVDKNALLYLQLAEQIKELEKQQDSLKTSFEGLLGTTKWYRSKLDNC